MSVFNQFTESWNISNYDNLKEKFHLYKKSSFKPHLTKMWGFINARIQHLNGNGRVILFGPGPVFFLEELLNKCQELILIGHEEPHLETIALKFPNKKISYLRFDLSGGLYRDLSAFFKRVVYTHLPLEGMRAGVIHLLKGFIPEKSSELPKADYVISLFASPQISNIVSGFESIYYHQNTQKPSEALQKAEATTVKRICLKHFRDLFCTATDRGEICYADRFKTVVYAPVTGCLNESLVTIQNDREVDLSNFFHIQKCEKWHWLEDPVKLLAFEVNGLVIQKQALSELIVDRFVPRVFVQVVGEESSIGCEIKEIDENIRERFKRFQHTEYANHICETRRLISQGAQLQGSQGLISGIISRRIIVLGGGLIEPWDLLIANCSELVIVDYDLKTLNAVAESLDKNKVTCIQRDLTGGLCTQVDAFTHHALSKFYSPEKYLTEMILFFEHLEIDTLKLEGLFQNGDYIVSSLVASQLVAHVYGYIDRNFNALFGVNLTTYFEGSSFTNVINEIRVNFMMKMYDKHYSDLALLAKPGGQIYFSDTIDQTDFSGKVPVTNIIIPEESLLRLEKHFEINKRACWTWQMFPENKVISGVQAYLLKSKLKSDA